jgi:anaerobic magnesium-protoporphyrin IX monomethyl ester cyclase
MVRVALVKLPATYATWYKRPMMGISYLAALLEQAGFDARIFDAYFNGWSPDELVESVVAYQPHVLGITAMTHEIIPASHLAERVKARLDIPAVIGGCHATALPSRTLEEFPAFDYLVHGEGETTFAELLKTLIEPASFQKIAATKGIAFRENGQVVVKDPRPPLSASELENLPFLAFHHY